MREEVASGRGFLVRATELLQRARLEDPGAGHWEAADLQWWSRMPRRSDAVEQHFWVDDEGPIAAGVLTDWGAAWGWDPILVPGTSVVSHEEMWPPALTTLAALQVGSVEVLARDDDAVLLDFLADAGFSPSEDRSAVSWMNAADRPAVARLPGGYALADRSGVPSFPHPMRRRNGEAVETRLRQCSLYDPELDLSVITSDGQAAGYALFWFDPVTQVGLVEPMRVEHDHQRRGLARGLLTAGLERLAERGARRLKVGHSADAAGRLYAGAGFRVAATSRTHHLRLPTRAVP